MNNNENIIFSGDGKGLSFRKFKHLLLLIHGEEISKADIIRKLRNNALEYAATLDTNLTAMEIIEDLKDAFDIGDSDDLTELTKLGEYKYNTLDILIGKFLSKCSAVDISEKFKIQLFYSAVGTELGIEITKCAPKSLKRAIDIAKSCEDGSIRIKGRSMYTGQLVAKTLQEFGNQRYLGSGSGYSSTSPQYVTSQNEQQSIESEEISTPIFKNQYYNRSPQMSPQSSPYKAPQNQVNSITKFCKYCKKKGHVIQECWSKDKNNNNNYNNRTNSITMVNNSTINSIGIDSMNAALLINNKNVRGLIDTGSSLTIVWESIAKKLKLKIENKQYSVKSASNNEIKIIGISNTTIKLGKALARVKVNVVKDNDTSIDCIFGIDTIIGLNLVIDFKEMIIKNLEFNVGTKLISKETQPCIQTIFKTVSDYSNNNNNNNNNKSSKSELLTDTDHLIENFNSHHILSIKSCPTIEEQLPIDYDIPEFLFQEPIDSPITSNLPLKSISLNQTENSIIKSQITSIQPLIRNPCTNLSRLDFAHNFAQIVNNNFKRPCLIKDNLGKDQLSQINKKVSRSNIQVGDYVYLQSTVGPVKLNKSWEGLFKVHERVSDLKFKLVLDNIKNHDVFYIKRLKNFFQLKGGDM
ncbi:hypothetical protein DDB_G0279931 [Dictyostelium discoideum AX4]|uniref:Peptidase A2 domain-containing protein n=1 Tax=Dictyostelium discoideum TaxID=44689 RepID=Q54W45_DICDI|nr:hypothetical protein DDB_G0279931 [Dictyostelium discoideum AX4]EAL67437.1 hypothetical protein DDB_G0279931 [Dictyostelium discoideum AX4]|eukprot:XP_641405.1 hypothetical protein DDB_G0279931 [Dictyostelium discoideum AX4]